jgi:hypothetical protein
VPLQVGTSVAAEIDQLGTIEVYAR